MSRRPTLVFVENRRIEGLRKDREYLFEENALVFSTKVRKLANGLLNSNGGVIFFGVDVRGFVKGVTVQSRKAEDTYRLDVDHTIGGFLPFVPPSKYRLQFHRVKYCGTKYVIELKVAAGDLGECYEDGSQRMFLVDDSMVLGPLYPQEIKDLALMRYKELTESFKFTVKSLPPRKANKTIVFISDDEDEEDENIEEGEIVDKKVSEQARNTKKPEKVAEDKSAPCTASKVTKVNDTSAKPPPKIKPSDSVSVPKPKESSAKDASETKTKNAVPSASNNFERITYNNESAYHRGTSKSNASNAIREASSKPSGGPSQQPPAQSRGKSSQQQSFKPPVVINKVMNLFRKK